MFLNHISDEGLVSILQKELIGLNHKKKNPIKKWAKDLIGISPKKAFKQPKSSISLVKGKSKLQLHTTLHPLGWLELEKQKITRLREVEEKLDFSGIADKNAKCNTTEKQYGHSSKS